MVENNERGNYLWNNFRCNTLEQRKKFRVNLVHFRNIFGAISLSGRSWSGGGRMVGERKVLFLSVVQRECRGCVLKLV